MTKLDQIAEAWAQRIRCAEECPLFYKCQVIVKPKTCADFFLSEVRAEIAKEIAGKQEEDGA